MPPPPPTPAVRPPAPTPSTVKLKGFLPVPMSLLAMLTWKLMGPEARARTLMVKVVEPLTATLVAGVAVTWAMQLVMPLMATSGVPLRARGALPELDTVKLKGSD